MKTLNELYIEIITNDELEDEIMLMETTADLVAFAQKHGCDVTLDEMEDFFKTKRKTIGELGDEELGLVAGGVNTQQEDRKSYKMSKKLWNLIHNQ